MHFIKISFKSCKLHKLNESAFSDCLLSALFAIKFLFCFKKNSRNQLLTLSLMNYIKFRNFYIKQLKIRSDFIKMLKSLMYSFNHLQNILQSILLSSF